MRTNRKHKRPYGTGSLTVSRDSAGRETWAGSWWGPDGRRVMRKIGRKRSAAFPDGLTEPQANRRLREMMGEPRATGRADRHTFADAAEAHLLRLENQGAKRSTIEGYRSLLRAYLLPYFGRRPVGRITERDVAAFDRLLRDRGRGAFG